MTLKEYFGDWLSVIDEAELSIIMRRLSVEYKVKSICPEQSNVFKAFSLCPLKNLKVVFIGQEPYSQKGVATGILFGNNKEISDENLSPSLKVIKEAVVNFDIPHNCIIFDPTLESWAKQGILMLNSALTVELNKVGSHTALWRPFIAKLLKNLSVYDTAIVYVLFGKQAQSFNPYINSRFNHIFEIEHPAYFARNGTKMPSKLFSDINSILKGLYNEEIRWYKEY